MKREELEAHIFAQILAAMADGKAMGRADPKQAGLRVHLLMNYLDRYQADAARAALEAARAEAGGG